MLSSTMSSLAGASRVVVRLPSRLHTSTRGLSTEITTYPTRGRRRRASSPLSSAQRLTLGTQQQQQQQQPVPAPPHRVQTLSPSALMDLSEPEYASQIVHGRGIVKPIPHPPTHRIPIATLTLRGHTPRTLTLFSHFASHAASALGIPLSHPHPLPIQRRLWTVLKGPFAHKKAQENFERKTHGRVLKAFDASEEVVERWLGYVRRYAHPGVGMRVVRWTRAPVGVGRGVFEGEEGRKRRERVERENRRDGERVRKLAERIVEEEMRAAGEKGEKVVLKK